MGFLIPPHPLTNFEMQKYYQNEPRFNGVCSRDNLPKKIKDGTYVINLDEYVDLEEIKKFVGNKNIIANIFWVQANDSVTCEYFLHWLHCFYACRSKTGLFY